MHMGETVPESPINEPQSGEFEVSPGRKPRGKVGNIPKPRSGDTGCDTVSDARPAFVPASNATDCKRLSAAKEESPEGVT
jgi:hypothetical protein